MGEYFMSVVVLVVAGGNVETSVIKAMVRYDLVALSHPRAAGAFNVKK